MRRRGQTLVASMIVLVIIMILAVVMLKGSGTFGKPGEKSARPDGKGHTIIGLTKYAAKDDVCRSNLGQVRESIQINSTTEDTPPASLKDLKLPAEFSSCPVGHEPYVYDPQTGQVHCPHLGHEKY